jgi:DNA polymerase I-like protein with 3'-5' exonuclease and polymerase domains
MLVFDIETNGFLDTVTDLFSIVIYDLETEELSSYADQAGYRPLVEGLKRLMLSPLLIGHNIQGYDIPVLRKLVPTWRPVGEVRDTLLMTRLIWPEIIEWDMKSKRVPSMLKGKHSLKAWGYRLGVNKGLHGETETWTHWTKDMQDYCEQDVLVTVALWNRISKEPYSEQAIKLEHEFASIIRQQEINGVNFNFTKAYKMSMELEHEIDMLSRKISNNMPPVKKFTLFTPKKTNVAKGYVAGKTINKAKEVLFNPGSRDHIANYFIRTYGWEPQELTDGGRPKVSGDILRDLPYKEAALMAKYLDARKLYSTIYSGENAWVKVQRNGKIHGQIITNGCLTGRCAHHSPNLGNIPSVRSYRGEECRELFHAPDGMSMVGADAAQIELRCLAHYLYPYDRGEYTRAILSGDIHTYNQEKAGLPTRDDAKRFIYALNYGAGQTKLGSIVAPDASKDEQLRVGKEMKQNFLGNTRGFAELLGAITSTILARGYLTGLDGRRLKPREDYRGLNTLLQAAGAVIMKRANVIFWEKMTVYGTGKNDKPGAITTDLGQVIQVLNVHDEIQVYAPEGMADVVGKTMVDAIKETTIYFNLMCPMDGSYKIGRTWKDTH